MQFLKDKKQVQLIFRNEGNKGAVYHVYDMNHLNRIPRRYTVEAGKFLEDEWNVEPNGDYRLEIYGPNGYFHKFEGNLHSADLSATIDYDHKKGGISIHIKNESNQPVKATITSNAYDYTKDETLTVPAGKTVKKKQLLTHSGNWYDFTVTSASGFVHRFAGRVETKRHSVSDPAMASEI